ncbi:histidine--tRNA ligase [Anaerosphaera multitolerans]|uniref:Histidine--tRNA ligase n=1 Tax=Anaerosphaera multitolerans TaxID=2487351 RepID=A0A437S9S1_9FIRM|nr:histidine--tRNA ligase [Anaerosphaera multitolerans]RVU55548.1 histidine--tRNA ligase [Anaerosphaera multitolerans]
MSQKVKASTLPGFLELLPQDQIMFNEMMDTIRRNFEKHGFLPIDTPAIERSEVLLAKGGGNTEKQMYRFKKGDTDMSLRFDLTVPLARYTVEHFNELSFPFRRYHIGKVYRGEKAQRGRFREFYQCDIDTIGNGSIDIANDAEFPVVIYHTFKELGFEDFTIRINNRRLLKGFYESLGISDSVEVLRIVDKIDKIGKENVKSELMELGLNEDQADRIVEFTLIEGSTEEIFKALEDLNIENEIFNIGFNELKQVMNYIEEYDVPSKNCVVDLKIARGLDYYTGTVYETSLDNYPNVGSVCSGGRYDDLASHYTDKKLPGVGLSIGLSRLFYQLNEAKIIQAKKKSLVDLIVIPMDGFIDAGIRLVSKFRNSGIDTIVYTEEGKLGKKFKYADALNIPYVVVIGENEVKTERYTLRNMETGDQDELTVEEIVERLK